MIWEISIENQSFRISEEEISEEQIVTDINEDMNIFETGEVLDVKVALQNLILKKLRSF